MRIMMWWSCKVSNVSITWSHALQAAWMHRHTDWLFVFSCANTWPLHRGKDGESFICHHLWSHVPLFVVMSLMLGSLTQSFEWDSGGFYPSRVQVQNVPQPLDVFFSGNLVSYIFYSDFIFYLLLSRCSAQKRGCDSILVSGWRGQFSCSTVWRLWPQAVKNKITNFENKVILSGEKS